MSSDDEDLGEGVLRLGLGTSPMYHFYFKRIYLRVGGLLYLSFS
jgi:hypothetical protein